jgi:molecular chaperone HscB
MSNAATGRKTRFRVPGFAKQTTSARRILEAEMAVDFNRNYFELFGLDPMFGIDTIELERVYRDLQVQVHPDRYVRLPDSERRLSMQWATRVNEAYRALKHPLSRAQYLLEINGVDTRHETNTAMSAEFLMEQMEWREAAAEARAAEDMEGLERLHHRLRSEADTLFAEVEKQIDHRQDYAAASDAVRRLMFVLKLKGEIDEALEALES